MAEIATWYWHLQMTVWLLLLILQFGRGDGGVLKGCMYTSPTEASGSTAAGCKANRSFRTAPLLNHRSLSFVSETFLNEWQPRRLGIMPNKTTQAPKHTGHDEEQKYYDADGGGDTGDIREAGNNADHDDDDELEYYDAEDGHQDVGAVVTAGHSDGDEDTGEDQNLDHVVTNGRKSKDPIDTVDATKRKSDDVDDVNGSSHQQNSPHAKSVGMTADGLGATGGAVDDTG